MDEVYDEMSVPRRRLKHLNSRNASTKHNRLIDARLGTEEYFKAAASNLRAVARERQDLMRIIKWSDPPQQRRSSGAGAGHERCVTVKR